jgi:hypothetical protein
MCDSAKLHYFAFDRERFLKLGTDGQFLLDKFFPDKFACVHAGQDQN